MDERVKQGRNSVKRSDDTIEVEVDRYNRLERILFRYVPLLYIAIITPV